MIYSLAPSERIDTGKTWPVYTVRLRALGHRAYGLNICCVQHQRDRLEPGYKQLYNIRRYMYIYVSQGLSFIPRPLVWGSLELRPVSDGLTGLSAVVGTNHERYQRVFLAIQLIFQCDGPSGTATQHIQWYYDQML